jgi:hypothetical protein
MNIEIFITQIASIAQQKHTSVGHISEHLSEHLEKEGFMLSLPQQEQQKASQRADLRGREKKAPNLKSCKKKDSIFTMSHTKIMGIKQKSK